MGTTWHPISEAPEGSRVLVAGWEPTRAGVAGYWWWHDDNIVDGKPFDNPTAILFTPAPITPKDPPTDAMLSARQKGGA